MLVYSIQNSARLFVDSINIFGPKEKRNTQNDIETGTREVVRGRGVTDSANSTQAESKRL